ncbi:hypothetical protein P4313_19815 [Bacillus tropicus]|uniref:hypothetical protein n=1 Tax=Bacillus tropicus TaxID=2026188 RepID=UPI0026B7C35E|nr:hypothetical protein [Bacillus tropicus]
MSRKEIREQLFKEKLERMKLEGEIRALQFSIKYKELSKQMKDNDIKFDLAQAKMKN